MKKKSKKKTWELHRHGKKWTQQEEDLLRKLYPGMFNHELEEHFNRSAGAIDSKAFRMGIRKNWIKDSLSRSFQSKLWSKKELKRFKKLYPVMPIAQLLVHFPKRKENAIKAKAGLLGLRKKYTKQLDWSNLTNRKFWREQKDLLRKLYPTTNNKELAKLFGRSKTAIQGQAQKLELHKSSYNPNAQNRNGTWFRWSDKEIKTLWRLWQQGHTDSEIAEIMGKALQRVRSQIHRQVREFGLQKKDDRKVWSKEENEYLIRHYHKKSHKQLVTALERTIAAIQGRASILNITQPNRWSLSDIKKLRQLWQQGHTAPQIAETIGKTKSSVNHQLERQKRDFGLPKRDKS